MWPKPSSARWFWPSCRGPKKNPETSHSPLQTQGQVVWGRGKPVPEGKEGRCKKKHPELLTPCRAGGISFPLKARPGSESRSGVGCTPAFEIGRNCSTRHRNYGDCADNKEH
eukprot:9490660-Pyramimonas_sp.AAC.1